MEADFFLFFFAGLVQGVAEWLPVSSKTMLFFLFFLWGLSPGESYLLGLFLNGATVLAAAIYFRRELWEMLRAVPSPLSSSLGAILLRFLLLSLILTGVIGASLGELTRRFLLRLGSGETMLLVGGLLGVTALITWKWESTGKKEKRVGDINSLDSILVGAAQGFSALPGVSRSGVTILALMLLGYRSEDALILSFLMSIPATIGGSIYAAVSSPIVFEMAESPQLILALLTATAIAIPTIHFLLEFSRRLRTYLFTAMLSALTVITGLIFFL